MRGCELTDEQWERIRPLLPPPAPTGRPRADDRKVLNGILYVLRAGCRWKDMPREYGSYVTAWRRLRRWQEEGVCTGIWQAFLSSLVEQRKLEWSRAFLDGRFVPAKRGRRTRAYEGGKGDEADVGCRRERDSSGAFHLPGQPA